ncbi:hypothetical protein LTR91_008223 [Friedmanniomyces endolithicus]|uniref:Uncharacterized protein n=1 Tax=Friedmanniomyces endolithicus TaxID=329885 RepID=A0AAN6QUS3_9PEZI|nr:hypothetical protein LTR57_011743 [Friedmanniomyces endolithicus]KAK0992667.1 hypothetical protein LTR91_008223 [Friedmanniomyces endolithicus]KAK1001877.1 hypothetical protein LTS01_004397 [Friedmanniomyces endolithicus]KAK1040720.1 hypothetical protein LTS16_010183 [Friedmanniomyces endolithicus]
MDFDPEMDFKGKGRSSGGEFGAIGCERAAKMANMKAGMKDETHESPGGVSLAGTHGKTVHNEGLTGRISSPSPVGKYKSAHTSDDDDDNSSVVTMMPTKVDDKSGMKTIDWGLRLEAEALAAKLAAETGQKKHEHQRSGSTGTAASADNMTDHSGSRSDSAYSPRSDMADVQTPSAANSGIKDRDTSGRVESTSTGNTPSPRGSQLSPAVTPPASTGTFQEATSTTPGASADAGELVSTSSFATFAQINSIVRLNNQQISREIAIIDHNLNAHSRDIESLQRAHDTQALLMKTISDAQQANNTAIMAQTDRLTQVIESVSRMMGHPTFDTPAPQQSYAVFQPRTHPGHPGYPQAQNYGNQLFGGTQGHMSNVRPNLQHNMQSGLHHSTQTNPQQNMQSGHQHNMQLRAHNNMQQVAYPRTQFNTQSNVEPTIQTNFRMYAAVVPTVTPNNTPVIGGFTTPNQNDDVFGPTLPSLVRYEQKGYTELLHSTFVKAENVARMFVSEPTRGGGRVRAEAIECIVKLCGEHINNLHQARQMMDVPDLRIALITVIFCDMLVDNILTSHVLGTFPHDIWTSRYMTAYDNEVWASNDYDASKNFPLRHSYAMERCRVAQIICALPGFQQWLKDKADVLTAAFLSKVLPLIHQSNYVHAEVALHSSVLEALKIAVRMRQEAKITDCFSYKFGCRWDHREMVQRNEEMQNRACDEVPSIFVIRITMAPRVVQKHFANERLNIDMCHKGEVILCERRRNLR